MKKNSRISVAIHSLIHLSYAQRALTSEEIGECQNTNPVIIRRILGELKKANLVSSEKGHGGGWIISRAPKDISFEEIFEAMKESLLPAPISLDKNEHCLVMKQIATTMDDFLEEAKVLLDQKLSKVHLSDITIQVDSLKQKQK